MQGVQGASKVESRTYRGQFGNHDSQHGEGVDDEIRQVVMCIMCAHQKSVDVSICPVPE